MNSELDNNFAIVRVYDLDRLLSEIVALRQEITQIETAPVNESLDPAEAAELLGVPENTVKDLAAQGRLPAKKVGRRWKFPRRALIDWLNDTDNASAGVVPLRRTGGRSARRK